MPSRSETSHELHGLSSEVVREAQLHVGSCVDCGRKVWKYSLLVDRFSIGASEVAPPKADCPTGCDHCGPLLRAATRLEYDPTPQEEMLLAELKRPSRPFPGPQPGWTQRLWQFAKWLVPATVFMVIVGLLSTRSALSPRPLSGPEFATFAVNTHRQHAEGSLALDIRSDSQQTVNNWLKAKSPFSLTLPVRPAAPGEERPYRLEGARLVQVGGKAAAVIAYQVRTSPVQAVPASLMVVPDSVVEASGGIEVDFKSLRLHYATVEGYRVVTWSQHGRTYALVSQEGNGTQRSCMVCHSAMRDRDLSQTPTPLRAERNAVEPVPQ